MLFLVFLIFLFALPLAGASTITRSFSKDVVSPGETVSVTLGVAITAGEAYYLIDDKVPGGWVVTNPGPEGSSEDPGHVKWAVIQGAASTSYTYEVTAPQSEGTYSFSGKYMFEGMKAEGSIAGQQTITVGSRAGAQSLNYQAILVTLILVGAVVLSFAIYKIEYGKHGK